MTSANLHPDGSTEALLNDFRPSINLRPPAPSSRVLRTFISSIEYLSPALAAKMKPTQPASSSSSPNKDSDGDQIELSASAWKDYWENRKVRKERKQHGNWLRSLDEKPHRFPRAQSIAGISSFVRVWLHVLKRRFYGFWFRYIWRRYGAKYSDEYDYTSHDARFEGKTLLEKKKLIIERELNKQGMGRYEIWIWFLCGFGYFLDLLWAQAFGLIIIPMQYEFGFDDGKAANLSSVWAGGLTAGALVFGVLLDVLGRYWTFNITVLLGAAFGMGIAGVNNYDTALILAFFNGFGIGGNIPIDTTICLEFLPEHRRDLLPLLSLFQPIGVILTTGISLGVIPRLSCTKKYGLETCLGTSNWGWRIVMLIIGGISLLVFMGRFVAFSFQESPKFLLAKNKDLQAVGVIQHIAKYNKVPTNLTIQTFYELDRIADSEGSRADQTAASSGSWSKVRAYGRSLKQLGNSWEKFHLLFLILLIYAFDFWGFSIVGALLPLILKRKNASLGLSLEETYRDLMIIYTPGLVGALLGYLMYHIPGRGRQIGMFVSGVGYCAALFSFTRVNERGAYIGVNLVEYFSQTMFNSILYSWTPEAFPSEIRGTAAGLASSIGRLFSVFMPLVASSLLESNGNDAPLILAGAGVAAMLFCVLVLPPRAFKPERLRGQ